MKRTKFMATPTKCRDVQPGDCISTAGPEYWDNYNPLSIGEKVYVATGAPGPPDDNEEVIYKITWDVVPFDPQADAAWGNSEQDEVE